MNISPSSLNSSISGLSPSALQPEPRATGFGDALKQALDATNNIQVAADKAAEGLNTGESQGLHDIMIRMEQADISMRLLVTMRNKVVDAYQEIMRMQI